MEIVRWRMVELGAVLWDEWNPDSERYLRVCRAFLDTVISLGFVQAQWMTFGDETELNEYDTLRTFLKENGGDP